MLRKISEFRKEKEELLGELQKTVDAMKHARDELKRIVHTLPFDARDLVPVERELRDAIVRACTVLVYRALDTDLPVTP